ncbi:MAG: hypothetical protein MZU97_01305 [Bacillus subtilis]|nr:hypothetical protein [Bacillus subtilis]
MNVAAVIQKNRILGIVPKFYLPEHQGILREALVQLRFRRRRPLPERAHPRPGRPVRQSDLRCRRPQVRHRDLRGHVGDDHARQPPLGQRREHDHQHLRVQRDPRQGRRSAATRCSSTRGRIPAPTSTCRPDRANRRPKRFSRATTSSPRNGVLLAEREASGWNPRSSIADVDLERIVHERRNTSPRYRDSVLKYKIKYQIVPLQLAEIGDFRLRDELGQDCRSCRRRTSARNFERIVAIQEVRTGEAAATI